MRVTINFHGLCMFVQDGGKVYVLLPTTGSTVPFHFPIFLYRGLYDLAPLQTMHVLPFPGQEILFNGLEGAGASINWGAGLEDITPIARVLLERTHLTLNTGKVAARVILDSGTVAGTGAVACWDVVYTGNPGGTTQIGLTDLVTFTGSVPGNSLEWGVRQLGSTAQPEWTEIDDKGTGELVLEVQHLTSVAHDPIGSPGTTRADHYAAYYELLKPGNVAQIPILRNVGPCENPQESLVGRKSATLYSCMVGGAS